MNTTTQPGTKTGKPIYTFHMTEDEYRQADDEMAGYCIRCGDQHSDNCEPDARGYRCESCGVQAVYGTQELLMMGRIAIVEEANEQG